MPKVTLYVPEGFNELLKRFRSSVEPPRGAGLSGWFQGAVRAEMARRLEAREMDVENLDIEALAARLNRSADDEEAEANRDGLKHGKRWAANWAPRSELEDIVDEEDAIGDVRGWELLQERYESVGRYAEKLDEEEGLPRYMRGEHEPLRMAFTNGFLTGAETVWNLVRTKLRG